jgi:ABC-type lipoprotein export system ATPase subunit
MERLTAAAPDKTMIFITHREKIAQYCTGTLSLER